MGLGWGGCKALAARGVSLTCVPRYWWLKISALANRGDWEEMEKFSKSKKSPIGYLVRAFPAGGEPAHPLPYGWLWGWPMPWGSRRALCGAAWAGWHGAMAEAGGQESPAASPPPSHPAPLLSSPLWRSQ